MPFLPFLHGHIVTMKYIRGLREQEFHGDKTTKPFKNEKYIAHWSAMDVQFLTRVRLGLFYRDLTHGFSDVTTVSEVVVACANFVYILLGSLPVRP